MPDAVSTLERALELAQAGHHDSVNAIRQQLKRDGYANIAVELQSPAVNQQIIALIRQSRA